MDIYDRNQKALVITQAPFRISFLGGGTDFPQHFKDHGGMVLATTINRFAYVTVQRFSHEFFDYRLKVGYRITENVSRASDIVHPAIRACFEKLAIDEGVELHHMADLPARTGFGASSTFVVAMLQALHAFQSRFRTPQELADEAIEVERYILKETGGYQDQILAAYGGLCLIRFYGERSYSVSQLPLPASRREELQRHMLLMYTGIQRDSYEVLRHQVARVEQNRDALRKMSLLAEEGANLLTSSAPLSEFGVLLNQSWQLKQSLSSVSLPVIDQAYTAGIRAGAYGAKLLGAGQGGFLLFIAAPESHEAIRKALPEMHFMKVAINVPGSRVIFSQA